jgi:hypothetical protein
MEGKPLYSKRNLLREFFCFKPIERIEITAYSTRFSPEEKAIEAAQAIEAKMAEEGRELLSIEVFQTPVAYTPFSSIFIVVRSPVMATASAELGAAVSTVALVVLGTIATVALAALGYFVYQIVNKLEPADQARLLKMVGVAALLFGGASVLREGRMLFSERG